MVDSETTTWIVVIGFLILIAIFVLPHMSEIMLGPRMDTTVKSEFDKTGNITKYELNVKMTDYGYTKLNEISKSAGKTSIKDYLLRNVSNKDDFSYSEITNKTDEKTIRLFTIRDFDPNSKIPTIHITKNDTVWIYEDESFEKSYFLPDNFVDEITYVLTAPTHSIKISPAYNETGFIESLLGKTKVTWVLDRQRDVIPFTGNAQPVPKYSVMIEAPKSPGFGIVLSLIAILIVFALIYHKKIKK